MDKRIRIGKRYVGEGEKTFVVAEVSANHLQDYGRAEAIIKAAAQAGADAVKLQTYTPDTITLDCDNDYFQITQGTIWDGTTLHKLYEEAYTPWEWQPRLMEYANGLGLECFSSPFDATAVDFMKEMDMPAYKVASFEINDIPLIRKIAGLGKPVILATGIAYLEDMERALQVCKEEGNEQVVLLKCTSAYPSPYEEMNLSVIPNMKETFGCVCGLSDHTLGTEVAVASVAIGAKIVEKHMTLCRADGGVDAAFSMEPKEFAGMVHQIRNIEAAIGQATYELTEKQAEGRKLGRSLFIAEDIRKGEALTDKNIRSVRPGAGLAPKHYVDVLGRKAVCDLTKGMPLSWEMIK